MRTDGGKPGLYGEHVCLITGRASGRLDPEADFERYREPACRRFIRSAAMLGYHTHILNGASDATHRHRFATPYGLRSTLASPLLQGPKQAHKKLHGRFGPLTEHDVLVVRRELVAAGRSADTLNHNRRVVRGIFGTHSTSPALAWAWMEPKVESEGKLRFYTPVGFSGRCVRARMMRSWSSSAARGRMS
jgi:hypothetical protein